MDRMHQQHQQSSHRQPSGAPSADPSCWGSSPDSSPFGMPSDCFAAALEGASGHIAQQQHHGTEGPQAGRSAALPRTGAIELPSDSQRGMDVSRKRPADLTVKHEPARPLRHGLAASTRDLLGAVHLQLQLAADANQDAPAAVVTAALLPSQPWLGGDGTLGLTSASGLLRNMPAHEVQQSATVGSDQDSAGQAAGGTEESKDNVALNNQPWACRGSKANDPVTTCSLDASEVKLLPTDMKEELAALQRALSLPASVEELQEGLTITDVDHDLMKSIRKRGKGGRNPASDARLDPSIDPKKAMRIMANRLSAARSKLRQKLAHEGQRVKLDMLASQKLKLASEMEQLKRLCEELEEAQIQLPAPTAACGEAPEATRVDAETAESCQNKSPHSRSSKACQPPSVTAPEPPAYPPDDQAQRSSSQQQPMYPRNAPKRGLSDGGVRTAANPLPLGQWPCPAPPAPPHGKLPASRSLPQPVLMEYSPF